MKISGKIRISKKLLFIAAVIDSCQDRLLHDMARRL